MKQRRFAGIIFLFLIATTLVGCGRKEDMAGKVVEAYLQTLVSGDADRLVSLSCGEYEQEAILELDSFQGVKPSLENLACTQSGTDGDTALVQCAGKIVATYGNEIQEFELSNQTYRVTQEGSELLVCGRE